MSRTFLQDVLKTFYNQNKYIGLDQGVLRLEDVFRGRMSKVNIFALIKTFSEDQDERHLQDFFKTSLSRQMFAGIGLRIPFFLKSKNTAFYT